MRALVTGASGSIGRYLVARLEQDKRFDGVVVFGRTPLPQITIHPKFKHIYGDIENEVYFGPFRGEKFDVIFHLAGAASHNGRHLEVNALGTRNLLEHVAPPRHAFIHTSSITVYGNPPSAFPHEWRETDPCKPSSLYSLSKLTAEQLINIKLGGAAPAVHLRLCANAGFGFSHGLVADVIRKLKNSASELELFGAYPGTVKPFSYAGDTARDIIQFATMDHKQNEVYNICPTNPISVFEVATICQKELGINKPIKWLGETSIWAGDNRYIRALSLKAQERGWDCLTSYRAIERALVDIKAERIT
jgi:nucleoside-diphosphate-sugar epimerase